MFNLKTSILIKVLKSTKYDLSRKGLTILLYNKKDMIDQVQEIKIQYFVRLGFLSLFSPITFKDLYS